MGAKHVAHTQNVKLILLWIVKAPLKYYRFGWIWHLSLTQKYGIAEEHMLNQLTTCVKTAAVGGVSGGGDLPECTVPSELTYLYIHEFAVLCKVNSVNSV